METQSVHSAARATRNIWPPSRIRQGSCKTDRRGRRQTGRLTGRLISRAARGRVSGEVEGRVGRRGGAGKENISEGNMTWKRNYRRKG